MCKALIIDDEDVIRQMISYALAHSGIDAEIAANGFEGISKFDREAFDVVITDMRMPGMDGNGIARHIRSSNKPATPIIAISGTAWEIEKQRFDAVLEKPFSIHLLVDTVKDVTRIPIAAVAGV